MYIYIYICINTHISVYTAGRVHLNPWKDIRSDSHTKIRKNVLINTLVNICFSRSALTFTPPPSFRFISDGTLKGHTVFSSNLNMKRQLTNACSLSIGTFATSGTFESAKIHDQTYPYVH